MFIVHFCVKVYIAKVMKNIWLEMNFKYQMAFLIVSKSVEPLRILEFQIYNPKMQNPFLPQTIIQVKQPSPFVKLKIQKDFYH